MVSTLVIAVKMHFKRMIMYFNFYHGITHFALQLPYGKRPPDICSEVHLSQKFAHSGCTSGVRQLQEQAYLCAVMQ